MELKATLSAHGNLAAGVHQGQKIIISAPPIESYTVDANEKMDISYENGETAVINPVEGVISLPKLREIYDILNAKAPLQAMDLWTNRGPYPATKYLAGLMDYIRDYSYFYLKEEEDSIDGYVYVPNHVGYLKICCAGTAEMRRLFINGSYARLPDYFCYHCSGLQTIDFPQNLIEIGTHAFDSCFLLGAQSQYFEVFDTLPEGVVSINDYAFYDCRNFNPSHLPQSLRTIGIYAFAAASTTSVSLMTIALTELPANLTSIGKYAFYNAQKLAISEIPIGVDTISDCTFYRCNKIITLSLPGVSKIKASSVSTAYAPFGYCTGLTEVTIGSVGHPVSEIMRYAFRNCSALTKIKVYTNGSLVTTYAPWGATNASVEYYDSETGALL